MISGVSSSLQYQSVSYNSSLTDDQKETLSEILSNYDAESMTDEDKKSLMDELKSSGIRPGKDVKDIMEASGFEMPKPPERPQEASSSESVEELPSFVQDFLEKVKSNSVSQSDVELFLQTANGTNSGNLIDETV